MNIRRLPIQALVEARSNELGLPRSELARRCGFKNINKGLRRIDQLLGGDLNSPYAEMIFATLPTALNVNKIIIDFAVRESVDLIEADKRRIADEQDAERRASFKPHGYLLGSERRPSQIVLFGVTGGAARWLAIPLDLSKPPITFPQQASAFARKTPVVPFHGKTVGFIVNFAPDHAVRFDLASNPVAVLPSAYLPGHTEIIIGGRKINASDRPMLFAR